MENVISEELNACIESAVAGGKAISDYRPSASKVSVKNDSYVGHHAIVTPADYNSQEAILKQFKSLDPDSLFITEEHVKDEFFKTRLIKNNLDALRNSKVYVIDELDGSSSCAIGHYEWSTSVGCLEKLVHTAGAVFAPQVGNGTLFYASLGNGAFIDSPRERTAIYVASKDLKDSYIIFGVDCFLSKYPVHNRLVSELADKARTINSNGSCALALGLVASGKADALIQPLQCPWDWAAGKLLVEEAGGRMIFYEMENGKIKPIDKLDIKAYNPDVRGVGFIAANPSLADNILDRLLKING